jgi:DNA polymerase III delta subunit
VILFVGDRKIITVEDVRTITTQQKQAQAFALGEALGDRDLPRLLRLLDRELGEIRTGVEKGKSEIGVLYGLISKVRALLLMRETRDRSLLKPVSDYSAFRAQVERLPSGQLPEDRRFNPLAGHPYVAFQAFRQSDNYATFELTRAMELLLEANLKLVGSSMDEGAVLRQALVEIVGTQPREKFRRQVS